MSASPRLHLVPSLPNGDGGTDERWDNEALCDALRAGEPRAQSMLFDRHAARIERVLYRILGPDDLQDPLNETFCRALDRLEELTEPSGLDRWLVAIAVNVAREHLRARRRRGWLELRSDDDLPELSYEEPLEPREAVREVFV